MATQPQRNWAIWRQPTVTTETGLPRSTLYRRISEGLWTSPVRLSARSVGWPAQEVCALNSARIAGKSDNEIRALVARLEAARKTAS